MKSTIEYPKTDEPLKFPQLMIGKCSKTIIVASYEHGDYLYGTVVAAPSGNLYNIGDRSERWVSSDFEPFNGKVTLSN